MKEFQICLVESSTFLSPSPRPKGLYKWLLPTLWVHKVGVQCKVAYLGGHLISSGSLWAPWLSEWR